MVFWAMRGSNPRHSGCKPDALPAELIALNADYYTDFRKKCQVFSQQLNLYLKLNRRKASLSLREISSMCIISQLQHNFCFHKSASASRPLRFCTPSSNKLQLRTRFQVLRLVQFQLAETKPPCIKHKNNAPQGKKKTI